VPSEFRFTPGAVQFHCPHCRQQYFGTDEAGLLVPRSFICVKCAEPIAMDQMVISPAHGVDESQTSGSQVSWMREGVGLMTRWRGTIRDSLFNPVRLGNGIHPGDPHRKVWHFALLNCVVFGVLSYVNHALSLGAVLGISAPAGVPPGAVSGMIVGLGALFGILGLIVYPIFILVWGLCTHLCLKVGSRKPAFSLKQTYASICYASGATVVNIIPCLGLYNGIGMLWWVVSSIFVVRNAQRVPIAKAIVATLLPPALILLTCIGGYVGIFAYAINSIKGSTTSYSAAAWDASDRAQSYQLLSALMTYSARSKQWPHHVAELVFQSGASPATFTLGGSGTFKDGLSILDSTLEQAVMLPPTAEKRFQTRLALLQMPPVYRFGDYVFCYAGITPGVGKSAAPAKLWILFSDRDATHARNAPSPLFPGGVSPAPTGSNLIFVGFADGHVGEYNVSTFASMLDEQNALRASMGLPPIPQPATLSGKEGETPVPVSDDAPR
jgi:hypothetical protein